MESFQCHNEKMPTNIDGQATRLWLFYCKAVQIRTFHITWFTFWLCFFGWFATANLYTYISADIGLTTVDKGIAGGCSVASTVIFRIIIGRYCDTVGPRLLYPMLLIVSAIPIAATSLVQNNVQYIIVSFFIGIAGAGFVVTQYHCSRMFAGKVVGTANAASAGWGHFGGGCANALMPLILIGIRDGLNVSEDQAWRYTMLVPAIAMVLVAFVYYFFTQDTPRGNFKDLRKALNNNSEKPKDQASSSSTGLKPDNNATNNEENNGQPTQNTQEDVPNALETETGEVVVIRPLDKSDNIEKPKQSLMQQAMCDVRTWIMFVIYAGCFGMELTILRFGSGYMQDKFGVSETTGGFIIGLFSIMNLFARPLGGITADLMNRRFGLEGRVYSLFGILIIEAIMLFAFALGFNLAYSIVFIILFSVAVQASEGVTFAVVPFTQPNAIGPVAGVVGAGGNFGALIFAWALFTSVPDNLSYEWAWIICAIFVFVASFLALLIKFSDSEKEVAQSKMNTFGKLPAKAAKAKAMNNTTEANALV